jgi:hypothetical protein
MKKRVLLILALGLTQIATSQIQVEALSVRFDSMATDPTAQAGKGFVYSNGVIGLYYTDLSHLGKILDSASIAPLTANIGWNSTTIPGLKLNNLGSESGVTLADGNIWYNTTSNAVRARFGGTSKALLKDGDGIGTSFLANEVLVGVTASDSVTSIPKVNNALAMVTTSTGVPTWFTPSNAITVYEDWPTNDTGGMNDWTSVISGSGAVSMTSSNADSNHPGIVRLATTVLRSVLSDMPIIRPFFS